MLYKCYIRRWFLSFPARVYRDICEASMIVLSLILSLIPLLDLVPLEVFWPWKWSISHIEKSFFLKNYWWIIEDYIQIHSNTKTFQAYSNDDQTDGHNSQRYHGFVDIRINVLKVCGDGESVVSSPCSVTTFQWTAFTTPTPVVNLPKASCINFCWTQKLKILFQYSMLNRRLTRLILSLVYIDTTKGGSIFLTVPALLVPFWLVPP